MLTHLHIRDFAIVEAVELEFGRGFTVLTGETGAGKSILVDALLLAVGGRADSGAVRHGAERAEVSATFAVAGNAAALAWLEEQSIEHDGECQLRRVVGADGRGRACLNGQPVPVQSLRALGETLVDVHGQLEFQSLARRGYQREAVDDSGRLAPQAQRVREAHAAWQALDAQRAAFEQRAARPRIPPRTAAALRRGTAGAGPAAGRSRRPAEERKRIAGLGRAGRRHRPGRGAAGGRRRRRDDGTGARAGRAAHSWSALDAALEPAAAQLEEATIAAREALASLRRYADGAGGGPRAAGMGGGPARRARGRGAQASRRSARIAGAARSAGGRTGRARGGRA